MITIRLFVLVRWRVVLVRWRAKRFARVAPALAPSDRILISTGQAWVAGGCQPVIGGSRNASGWPPWLAALASTLLLSLGQGAAVVKELVTCRVRLNWLTRYGRPRLTLIPSSALVGLGFTFGRDRPGPGWDRKEA
jgi:hypothetical protein